MLRTIEDQNLTRKCPICNKQLRPISCYLSRYEGEESFECDNCLIVFSCCENSIVAICEVVYDDFFYHSEEDAFFNIENG